jgi:hypothetical protein
MMGVYTKRMVDALEEAGVYLRPHAGDDYVGGVADAVLVLYDHMTRLDSGNRASWDMSVLELLSIYGRAQDCARFTPDPPPPPPEPLRAVPDDGGAK